MKYVIVRKKELILGVRQARFTVKRGMIANRNRSLTE
jgi:hypothetical protein